MNLVTARAKMVEYLRALPIVVEVLPYLPTSNPEIASKGVTVVFAPPGRTATRGPGRLQETFTQEITVMAPVGSDPVAAMAVVETAVAEINAVFDVHVSMGSTAVSSTPMEWTPGQSIKAPPNTGLWYAAQVGRTELVFISTPDMEA